MSLITPGKNKPIANLIVCNVEIWNIFLVYTTNEEFSFTKASAFKPNAVDATTSIVYLEQSY